MDHRSQQTHESLPQEDQTNVSHAVGAEWTDPMARNTKGHMRESVLPHRSQRTSGEESPTSILTRSMAHIKKAPPSFEGEA